MAQILVPTSDQAAGSWTNTPLWSKVDDDSTANPTGDGTTISSDAVGNKTNTSNYDFKLASGTDPSSSSGHILRARWNHDQTGRSMQANFELYQGDPAASGTLIATLQVDPDVGTTEVESTYTLSGTEADNITDYTDLYGRMWGRGTGGGPGRSLIVDLVEFEIPDAGASPVSVSLTPATAATSAETLTVNLSALAVALTQASVASSAGALSPTLAPLAVSLTPASVATSASALTVNLAALATALTQVSLTTTAQALTVNIGSPVEVSLTPATAGTSAQALNPTLAALAIALTPSTVGAGASSLSLSLAPLSTSLTPAQITAVAQALGVTPAALAVALTPVELVALASVINPAVGQGGYKPYRGSMMMGM